MPFHISPRAQSAIGLVAFIAIAWLLSERKRAFPLGMAVWVTLAQVAFAAAFLYIPPARAALAGLNVAVDALQQATLAGTSFVFGYVGGGDVPFVIKPGGEGLMFSFAFMALPLLIFMSALAGLLWHWGVLKVFVRGLAFFLQRAFGVGGAVALAAAANVFFGQTEAPLLIRHYLDKISRSELFMVITAGYATVAGTVVVLYASILNPVEPSVIGHIVLASIISAPAALLMGRIMTPPAKDEIPTSASAADDFKYEGSMDAFTTGATEGLKLYLNIIASIIAFLALAALINIMLSAAPDVGGAPLTLERMLGWMFAPAMWLAGVPWSHAIGAGELMGVKTALNEVVAYLKLATDPQYAVFDQRTRLITIYAMCGFANIGSLGIVIGGLSSLAPSRRSDVIELAPRALIGGTLATLSTGAVIGLIWMG